MSDKKTLNFCPECGEKQIGNKFCSNCGCALLNESSEKVKLESKNSKPEMETEKMRKMEEDDTPSKDNEQELDKSATPVAQITGGFLDLHLAIPFYIIFALVNCIIAPGMNGPDLFNDLSFAFIILVLPYILLVIVFSLFKSLFNLKFVFYYHNGFFGLSLLCEFLIVYGAIN